MVNSIRKKYKVALLCLIGMIAGLPVPSQAKEYNLPFNVGETLTYEAKWLIFKAGTVEAGISEVSEVSHLVKGKQKLIRFWLHAVTSKAVSRIWWADDYFNSYWDPVRRLPKRLEVILRESTYKADKLIEFDHENKLATVTIDDKEPDVKELDPTAQDFFSSGYLIRTKNLVVGQRLTFPVFESKTNYDVIVDVLQKERVAVMGGEVDTIKLKSVLNIEGAFRKKGAFFVWLSDDEQKVPVMMKIKIFFGYIYLTLIKAEGVDLNILPLKKK